MIFYVIQINYSTGSTPQVTVNVPICIAFSTTIFTMPGRVGVFVLFTKVIPFALMDEILTFVPETSPVFKTGTLANSHAVTSSNSSALKSTENRKSLRASQLDVAIGMVRYSPEFKV